MKKLILFFLLIMLEVLILSATSCSDPQGFETPTTESIEAKFPDAEITEITDTKWLIVEYGKSHVLEVNNEGVALMRDTVSKKN